MDSNVPPESRTPPTPPPLLRPQPLPRLRARKSRAWMIAAVILFCLLILSLFSNFTRSIENVLSHKGVLYEEAGPKLNEVLVEHEQTENKILIVQIEGIIMSGSFDPSGYGIADLVDDQLKRAAKDKNVRAVLLKVNSPGGEVLASDEIYKALAKFQVETGKPVIASMGSLAASGGYYVSAPCQWIVANDMTMTGSIGVIMQAINYRGLMDKVGLRLEIFKSGRFKDMLSGSKKESEITPEERQMVQKLVDDTFTKFKNVVETGRASARQRNEDLREKGRSLVGNWEDFADGRILSGEEAHKLGFVDELGNFDVAVARAKKLARVDKAKLIQYQQRFDFSDFFRLFGKSEAQSLKVDLGIEMPKLQAGQLYFLSPLVLP